MELNQFGIIGLGVMGRNLALNFLEKGIKISAFNRHVDNKEVDIAKNFAASHPGVAGYDDLGQFTGSLSQPRKILLMVNAGRAVDDVIEQIIPHLGKGDLIIDGGNSLFQDTQKRFYQLKEKGILFIGLGVSGGEEGARKGPSLMPGGSEEGYRLVAPFLDRIAAKDKNGRPCCTYAGPEGAGHFVKMVHNGIEYAEMQILAEMYYVMRHALGYDPEKIAQLFHRWQNEGEGSFLLEITQAILRKKEGNELLLDKILDAAEQKGTGTWTLVAALELKTPLDTISAAVSARMISAMKDKRVQANNAYQSHLYKTEIFSIPEEDLKSAYIGARIMNHIVGFNMLRDASDQYKWNLNLGEIARIWTNGCIIRSELMSAISEYYAVTPDLLLHPQIVAKMGKAWGPLAQVVGTGLQKGLALPVLSAATNAFLSATTADSPANMIQAQRDFFGAHTFRRVDSPLDQYFHTNWTS